MFKLLQKIRTCYWRKKLVHKGLDLNGLRRMIAIQQTLEKLANDRQGK